MIRCTNSKKSQEIVLGQLKNRTAHLLTAKLNMSAHISTKAKLIYNASFFHIFSYLLNYISRSFSSLFHLL